MAEWSIHLLTTPEEMLAVEALQRVVWSSPDMDIVPKDLLLTAIHNGGLAIGAFAGIDLVGICFGFPGFYPTSDGPRLKHNSFILGVHPDWSGQGIGFALKRAQWQMVRNQGIDRITWTYDPLLSRNAHLNISRLGAVCNTYLRSEYGEMRDGLNAGLPSDRFQVDWWLNTPRLTRRLGRHPRPALSIDHYRLARATLLSAIQVPGAELHPPEETPSLKGTLLLVEIPPDFLALKTREMSTARDWRFYMREVFETAFASGYMVTDFVHEQAGSFYVLTSEGSTLQDN